MAFSQTKSNIHKEFSRPRYSELGDEVRAKNKYEDRLLDVRLKYYEREKNIRLNILRKEQQQLESARALLYEQIAKIRQDRQQRQSIPTYIPNKPITEHPLIQLSTPNLFNSDWEQPISKLIPVNKPVTPKNIVRPHSAG